MLTPLSWWKLAVMEHRRIIRQLSPFHLCDLASHSQCPHVEKGDTCLTTYNGSSGGSVSHSVLSDSLQPHGLWPARLLCPWGSPGKNTGVDCHSLLQRIFPTQGSNPGLLHCRQILLSLSYREDHEVYCEAVKRDDACKAVSVAPHT